MILVQVHRGGDRDQEEIVLGADKAVQRGGMSGNDRWR